MITYIPPLWIYRGVEVCLQGVPEDTRYITRICLGEDRDSTVIQLATNDSPPWIQNITCTTLEEKWMATGRKRGVTCGYPVSRGWHAPEPADPT